MMAIQNSIGNFPASLGPDFEYVDGIPVIPNLVEFLNFKIRLMGDMASRPAQFINEPGALLELA